MRVMSKRVGKGFEVVEIDGSLESMQEFVGGLIELYYIRPDMCVVCNEEGKLLGLPSNAKIGREVIAGDFFICRSFGDDLVGLRDEDIVKLEAWQNDIELM